MFVAYPQTLCAFRRAQRFQPRFAGVEHRSRRQAEPDEIVAVLPRKHEVVLPAVEAAAQGWTAFVDRAPAFPQIDTTPVRVSRQNKDGIPGCIFAQRAMLEGFHVIALLRMEHQALIAPAAFRTAVAEDRAHFSCLLRACGRTTRFHHMIAPVANMTAGASPNSAQAAFVA